MQNESEGSMKKAVGMPKRAAKMHPARVMPPSRIPRQQAGAFFRPPSNRCVPLNAEMKLLPSCLFSQPGRLDAGRRPESGEDVCPAKYPPWSWITLRCIQATFDSARINLEHPLPPSPSLAGGGGVRGSAGEGCPNTTNTILGRINRLKHGSSLRRRFSTVSLES